MSDLVERLRDLAGEDWLAKNHFNEAADEIERLRAELEKADETMIRAAIREKQMADELANHKEAQDDHNRLVRELDVIWNGEAGAAKQASLCDVVSQISREWAAIKGQKPVAITRAGFRLEWVGPEWGLKTKPDTLLYALSVAPVADKDAERLDEGWRRCEFCGCHTNAKLRMCCSYGHGADLGNGAAMAKGSE